MNLEKKQEREKKEIQERIHINFKRELDDIRKDRFKRDLEDNIIPIKEVTRMMLNADHWPGLKDELTTKRRKQNE